MDEQLQPFGWWHSGRYWYCHLQESGKKPVSGAGATKPQAVADARKELQRRRQRRSDSASGEGNG